MDAHSAGVDAGRTAGRETGGTLDRRCLRPAVLETGGTLDWRSSLLFETEGGFREGLIHLEVGVGADPGLAVALVEDLFETDRARGIEPDGHHGNFFANIGIFGDELELIGGDSVDGLFAEIFDRPLRLKILAAGAEADSK